MNCIPNPLVNDNFDNQPLETSTAIRGKLHADSLIETPGIWYWIVTAHNVIRVSINGVELEENYDYRLKGDSVLIFEVIGADSVQFEIIVKRGKSEHI